MRIEKQITIDEKPYTLAIGLLAFRYIKEATGKTITEITSEFQSVIDKDFDVSEMISMISYLLYGCLNAAQTKNGKKFSMIECDEIADQHYEVFATEILPGFVSMLEVKINKSDSKEPGEELIPQ